MALVRYLPSGALDLAFGDRGVVTLAAAGKKAQATGVSLLPSGKILVGGTASERIVLARLHPDGTRDTTFGTGGVAMLAFGADATDGNTLLALGDGDVVVAGSALGTEDHDFAFARFDEAGRPDVLCGSDGRVRTDFGGAHDAAFGLAPAADGGLYLAGEGTGTDGIAEFALAKYREDGSLDTTFGTGGRVMLGFGSAARVGALRVLPTGTLVAAGTIFKTDRDSDVAFAFFRPDGTPDTTFGEGGLLVRGLGGEGLDGVNALALAPLGRIVAAGRTGADFAVTRVVVGAPGDATWDGKIDVVDVFALVNYLYAAGPVPAGHADANGDESVDVRDLFYLVNFLYAGGPAPR